MRKVKLAKLNLGCGLEHLKGYTNIDIREEVEPDEVWDICFGLPYKDNTASDVVAYDFMEHIPQDKVIFVMKEIHRILTPEGIFHFRIPSTDGRGWAMDPTHRSFWNINSWLYFCEPAYWELYPNFPRFNIIELKDCCPSEEDYKIFKIIHTQGKVSPIK